MVGKMKNAKNIELASPKQISRETGINHVTIYGLIRKGEIPLACKQPKLVAKEATINFLEDRAKKITERRSVQKDAKQSGKPYKRPPQSKAGVKKGDIVSYSTHSAYAGEIRVYRRILQIDGIGKELIEAVCITDGRKRTWSHGNLIERLKKKEVVIESIPNLLNALQIQLRLMGKKELAKNLAQWRDVNEVLLDELDTDNDETIDLTEV